VNGRRQPRRQIRSLLIRLVHHEQREDHGFSSLPRRIHDGPPLCVSHRRGVASRVVGPPLSSGPTIPEVTQGIWSDLCEKVRRARPGGIRVVVGRVLGDDVGPTENRCTWTGAPRSDAAGEGRRGRWAATTIGRLQPPSVHPPGHPCPAPRRRRARWLRQSRNAGNRGLGGWALAVAGSGPLALFGPPPERHARTRESGGP
jgi:hypothetical protein